MLRLLRSDWQLKLLALLLAALIWVYANSVVTRTIDIEVKFGITKPDSVEADVLPKDRIVKLSLRGPAGVIGEVREGNVRVQYVLSNPRMTDDSTMPITFDGKMVSGLPPQVQVVDFAPSGFLLKVRPLATETFPVRLPEVVGTPRTGYQAGTPQIRGKREVRVSGPAALLRKMKDGNGYVIPEPVDVTNHAVDVESRFHRIQSTVRIDNDTVDIRCDDTIDVFVPIRTAHAEGVIKGVKVDKLTPPGMDYAVIINKGNPVDVPVVGPPEVIRGLSADKVRAYIDIRDREPSPDMIMTEQVIVEGLPPGVRVKEPGVQVTATFVMPRTEEKKEPVPPLPEPPNP